MTKKKDIYDETYTHQTSVTKRNYYINKKCTKMGGSKNVNERNEFFNFYSVLKVQQSSKMRSP